MKTFTIVAALLSLVASVGAQSPTVLPAEASLRLIVDDEILSSKKGKSKIGDPVSLTAADDVIADGKTVIPQGSKIEGRVTHVVSRGRWSNPGELSILLSHALVNGERVLLGIKYELIGKEPKVLFRDKILNSGHMTAPRFLPWGQAQEAELKRGDEVRIEPEPVVVIQPEEIVRRVVTKVK